VYSFLTSASIRLRNALKLSRLPSKLDVMLEIVDANEDKVTYATNRSVHRYNHSKEDDNCLYLSFVIT